MRNKNKQNKILIYQSKTGALELRGDFRRETIWASQVQISDVFETERSVVTKHIRNILKDKELDAVSVCAKIAHTAPDRKTYQVKVYNLDVILAVGYRVNSKRAIEFRQWATKILRDHITRGYTINPRRVRNNYAEFQKAIANIKSLLPAGANIDHASVLELISAFADTWLSLEAYDQDKLAEKGFTKRSSNLTARRLEKALADFKNSLVIKGGVSDLFGRKSREDSIAGIVGNVMQSFGGKSLYPTAEEKAAHLLYFMVKSHPFVDGNKRNGAYAFVWFLNRAGILDRSKISPAALTAITLLVAESEPGQKQRMIRLVLQLLKKT